MGLTMKERKRDKGIILIEFIELTGYGRRYASYVLRSHGKKIRINEKDIVMGDVRRKVWVKRSRVYDDAVLEVFKEGLVHHGLYLRQEDGPGTEGSSGSSAAVSGDQG